MKNMSLVLWFVTLRILVDGYQGFRRTCCLQLLGRSSRQLLTRLKTTRCHNLQNQNLKTMTSLFNNTVTGDFKIPLILHVLSSWSSYVRVLPSGYCKKLQCMLSRGPDATDLNVHGTLQDPLLYATRPVLPQQTVMCAANRGVLARASLSSVICARCLTHLHQQIPFCNFMLAKTHLELPASIIHKIQAYTQACACPQILNINKVAASDSKGPAPQSTASLINVLHCHYAAKQRQLLLVSQ